MASGLVWPQKTQRWVRRSRHYLIFSFTKSLERNDWTPYVEGQMSNQFIVILIWVVTNWILEVNEYKLQINSHTTYTSLWHTGKIWKSDLDFILYIIGYLINKLSLPENFRRVKHVHCAFPWRHAWYRLVQTMKLADRFSLPVEEAAKCYENTEQEFSQRTSKQSFTPTIIIKQRKIA